MLEFLKFSLISTLITTAAGCVMWYFTRYDFDFKEIYNEGCDLYKRKQYKAAFNKFKLAVARFPEQFQGFYNFGLCAIKLKKYVLADEAFTKALNLNKRDVDTIYNLAFTKMHLKEYEKAIEYFNLIAKSYPDDAEVLFNLGFISANLQKLDEAKNYIEKAIVFAPEKSSYKMYYLDILDALFDQSGNPQILDKILSYCQELLTIYPNDEGLVYKTAVVYAKMGDWENSVNYCERLFSLNPNSHKACSQYGLTLFCKGETSQAIEMYERAIHLAPNIPDSYLNLVFAYDKAGDFNSAFELVETFIKKFPNDPSIEIAKDYLERQSEKEPEENISNSIDSALLPSQTPKVERVYEVIEDENVTVEEKNEKRNEDN